MKRRDFLAASAIAGIAPLAGLADHADAQTQTEPQYLEMRRYHLLGGPKQRQLNEYLEKAAIPAWNRAGVGPVGVFNVVYGTNSPTVYVLLTHPNLASVANVRRRLEADAAYQAAGATFLNATLADPAFVRIESSLMRAFTGMPRLEVPASAAGNQPRIFELRRYESHGDIAAMRKVQMFDRGEIAIFRKTGLTPVFFGETLIGEQMPNLTYMLTFRDMAARDAAWDVFRQDPDWRTLSADPYYADTVSAITDVILRPTAYSQV